MSKFLPQSVAKNIKLRDKEEVVALSCSAQHALNTMSEEDIRRADWNHEHLKMIVSLTTWILGGSNNTFDELVIFARSHIALDPVSKKIGN